MDAFFISLIKVALDKCGCLPKTPSVRDWNDLFLIAEKHSLLGVCFVGIEKLHNQHQVPGMDLLMDWLGQTEYIKSRNLQVSSQCRNLQKRLDESGIKSCILKGQGFSAYYGNLATFRQPGDIDVWIPGDIKTTISRIRELGIKVDNINIKHADASIFEDTPVEVHFIPSWFYNPRRNRLFLDWVDRMTPSQMEHEVNGMIVPTTKFNVIYILLHIYRHVFDEGIGLRQLLDYYFVLLDWEKACTTENKSEVVLLLNDLGMLNFASSIMWVLHEAFGLERQFMLCEPNEKEGRFLLDEIMRGGNFGHYAKKDHKQHGPWMRGIENAKRNMRFVTHYPNEILWAPFWKVWHWWYRKKLNE